MNIKKYALVYAFLALALVGLLAVGFINMHAEVVIELLMLIVLAVSFAVWSWLFIKSLASHDMTEVKGVFMKGVKVYMSGPHKVSKDEYRFDLRFSQRDFVNEKSENIRLATSLGHYSAQLYAHLIPMLEDKVIGIVHDEWVVFKHLRFDNQYGAGSYLMVVRKGSKTAGIQLRHAHELFIGLEYLVDKENQNE